MSSTLYTVTIDCAEPARLADFWSAVLGYAVARSNDEEVAIAPAGGAGATLLFLRVPDRKTVKNRFHLDVNVADHAVRGDARRRLVDAHVARLVEAGATRVGEMTEYGESWVILQDPEGNEFCVQ